MYSFCIFNNVFLTFIFSYLVATTSNNIGDSHTISHKGLLGAEDEVTWIKFTAALLFTCNSKIIRLPLCLGHIYYSASWSKSQH